MKQEIIEIYNSNKNYYKKHLTLTHLEFLKNKFGWTNNIKEQIYCLRNNITNQPSCGYAPCDKNASFKGMTEGYGAGGCCRKHGQFISNLEKYGYEMPLQNKCLQQKIKKSNLDRYGVENPMQRKEIAAKVSETKKKYDDKQKQQYLERRTYTWRKKYKLSNVFENKTMIKAAMMEKYGITNPAHEPKFKSDNSIPKSVRKEYIWKNGKISKVQGFEPSVLCELEEQGYGFEEVKTKKSDMPAIWYVGEDGKKHRYYPDFYIPKENLIIEVKSSYTMLYDFYKNNLKAVATKELGYNYKLEVKTK